MDSSVSVLNTSLSLNWWIRYLDFLGKGGQGVCLRDIFGIWKWVTEKHGSFGEIVDNGCQREEGGKIGNRR